MLDMRVVAAAAVLGFLPLFGACVGEEPAGDPNATAHQPFVPRADDPFTTRRLRRLSSREYDNVVRDLLGDTTQPATRFLRDAFPNGYDNGSAGLAVQADQAAAYQAAAEDLAASAVAERLLDLTAGCDPTESGDAACEAAFLGEFAPRAFRRPLTDGELERLEAVFRLGAESGGFELGVRTALELILQSPEFLYREELGGTGAAPQAGSSVRLTDYELASELSFLLTGSLPDDELWALAQAGRLSEPDTLAAQAKRLLASPRAAEALRGFLHQWLATDRLADLTKDSRFYPSFSAATAASMHGELDRFFDAVAGPSSGSLRALFSSNRGFVDANLAEIYGVEVSGDGFTPLALDPELRSGVLTRAGFLAVHSALDSSGPISRGVFVLQSLLCAPPAPPPPNVPPVALATDESAQEMTTRQRFDQHQKDPLCSGCHARIDGIGFGFEEFDGIGAYRTSEHGLPVDSSGALIGEGEIDGDFSGAAELAARLSGSQVLEDCFLRQVYRYAMGEIEPSADPRSLAWLRQGFSPDTPLGEAWLTLISNPRFSTRRAR